MPDWSIKMCPEGKPAVFTPDIDGTKPGTPLKVVQGDLVSWNNMTRQGHWPCAGRPEQLRACSPRHRSIPTSSLDRLQRRRATAGTTISYYCNSIPKSAARSSSSNSAKADGRKSRIRIWRSKSKQDRRRERLVMTMHGEQPNPAIAHSRSDRAGARLRRAGSPRWLLSPALVVAAIGCGARRSLPADQPEAPAGAGDQIEQRRAARHDCSHRASSGG